jgi:16S rRNA (adenine1518-N6/adenine1519-N6)-dimethyltransferase
MQEHYFKKQFGQNFLTSKRFVDVLIAPLDISKDDIVIEIGPGAGFVTEELLHTGAFVIAIEIDRTLIPRLNSKFSLNENFILIEENIMQANIPEILQRFNPEADKTVKVVGSLPYNISKDIIHMLLHHNLNSKAINKIQKMSFIVQDEVAKLYVAKPPRATSIGMQTQLFAEIKKYESIPKTQFKPTPKVDGGIITFKMKPELAEHTAKIEKLIKIGFTSPRKTLINNMRNSHKFENKVITSAFEKSEIDVNKRASEMSLEEWELLYSNLSNL